MTKQKETTGAERERGATAGPCDAVFMDCAALMAAEAERNINRYARESGIIAGHCNGWSHLVAAEAAMNTIQQMRTVSHNAEPAPTCAAQSERAALLARCERAEAALERIWELADPRGAMHESYGDATLLAEVAREAGVALAAAGKGGGA